MAEKPASKFKIPCSSVLVNLEGGPLTEPVVGLDGKLTGDRREVTLGMILVAALMSDARPEGVTLPLLDRLELSRRFKSNGEPEIRVATNEAIKKFVSEAYRHAPLISGQVLEMLGDEPSSEL